MSFNFVKFRTRWNQEIPQIWTFTVGPSSLVFLLRPRTNASRERSGYSGKTGDKLAAVFVVRGDPRKSCYKPGPDATNNSLHDQDLRHGAWIPGAGPAGVTPVPGVAPWITARRGGGGGYQAVVWPASSSDGSCSAGAYKLNAMVNKGNGHGKTPMRMANLRQESWHQTLIIKVRLKCRTMVNANQYFACFLYFCLINQHN